MLTSGKARTASDGTGVDSERKEARKVVNPHPLLECRPTIDNSWIATHFSPRHLCGVRHRRSWPKSLAHLSSLPSSCRRTSHAFRLACMWRVGHAFHCCMSSVFSRMKARMHHMLPPAPQPRSQDRIWVRDSMIVLNSKSHTDPHRDRSCPHICPSQPDTSKSQPRASRRRYKRYDGGGVAKGRAKLIGGLGGSLGHPPG